MKPIKFLQENHPQIFEELKGEAPAFIAMITSKGFELWDKYMETMEGALKENALSAETLAEREEARCDWIAFKRTRAIPLMLLDFVKALDSVSELADTLQPSASEEGAS